MSENSKFYVNFAGGKVELKTFNSQVNRTLIKIHNFEFEKLTLYDTLIKAFISKSIESIQFDNTDLKQWLSFAESAIITLNGEGDGSIKKQIDDVFNDFATKVSDDNVKNTFKELVNYCATHSAEAAEMAGKISALEDIEYVPITEE